jgi:hypothetical protein
MTVLVFLLSIVGGVLFWNRIAGRFEGDRLERSLRLPLGRYYLHVHHWLYCLVLMGGLYRFDVAGPGCYGFLCGSIAQGFTYRDWYLLVYRKNRAEAIYARWSDLAAPVPESEA